MPTDRLAIEYKKKTPHFGGYQRRQEKSARQALNTLRRTEQVEVLERFYLKARDKQTHIEHRGNRKCTNGILDGFFGFQAARFSGAIHAVCGEDIFHIQLPVNFVISPFSHVPIVVKN
jgi:hypothetical protein